MKKWGSKEDVYKQRWGCDEKNIQDMIEGGTNELKMSMRRIEKESFQAWQYANCAMMIFLKRRNM